MATTPAWQTTSSDDGATATAVAVLHKLNALGEFFITSSIHFPRTAAPRRVFPYSAPFRIRVACWARRRRRRNGQCSDSRCNRPLVLEGYGIPAPSTSRHFLRSLDVSFCSRADRFNASAPGHSADA